LLAKYRAEVLSASVGAVTVAPPWNDPASAPAAIG
jgi:hypothetical protein